MGAAGGGGRMDGEFGVLMFDLKKMAGSGKPSKVKENIINVAYTEFV